MKRYTYTWNLANSTKRYKGVTYHDSWEKAKRNIKAVYPKRKNIRRTK